MSTITALFLALLGLAVLAWLVRRARRSEHPRGTLTEDIDCDVLEQAEEEVRDLGAFTTPDEAENDLPDWGPGTPRR